MENRDVSIDDVRALVAERQRYDDWLTVLEERRDETPQRVFERVQADYRSRRDDVLTKLHAHVDTLESMRGDFERLSALLDAQLATLEDERAEAMLRTVVGEFDDDRWENVRKDVEAQIEDFSAQRDALQTQLEEVATLLLSARVIQADNDAIDEHASTDVVSPDKAMEIVAPDAHTDESGASETEPIDDVTAGVDVIDVATPEPADAPAAVAEIDITKSMSGGVMSVAVEVDTSSPLDISEDMLIDDVPAPSAAPSAAPVAKVNSTQDDDNDNADLDDALALFSSADDSFPTITPAPPAAKSSRDGVDVFEDAGLTDRHSAAVKGPERSSTATVTPPSAPASTQSDNANAGFDDLAFLRSVVDPSGKSKSSLQGDQQKTLRCTECSTMNLPTEWYCERCGGELAAF